MIKATVYGRSIVMQGSPYTLLVFREEFGEDLFGCLSGALAGGQAPVEPFLRIAWAMCRTADDAVAPYAGWLKEFPEDRFSLADTRPLGVIDSAIKAELFRDLAPGSCARARWRLARCLERLAQRVGP